MAFSTNFNNEDGDLPCPLPSEVYTLENENADTTDLKLEELPTTTEETDNN